MKIKFTIHRSLLLFIALVLISVYYFQSKVDYRRSWEKYLAEEYQKINIDADGPDKAAYQNYFMTIDPNLKRVPSEKLITAYRTTKELISQNKYKSTQNELEWTETRSNMGGRTRAIMFDPNDPDHKKLWAGGVTGGLWYNNDIFDTLSPWQSVNDFWPSLSVSCIISDPNNPMTFYAGTGESQTARLTYRESSGVGIGIWKTIDGGITWQIIPSTEEFKYISDLKIRDEEGTSILYAGVVSGYYKGEDFISNPSDGLYRSPDNGTSWEQVFPNISGQELPYIPAYIEIGPTGRIFVGTMKNFDGDGGATILFSDEGINGTWTVFDDYEEIIKNSFFNDIPGRVVIACAPSNPDRVYALIGAGWINSTNFNYSLGQYILRSDDGGLSWTQRMIPDGNPEWANISWHSFMVEVNPTNPDQVFVGGKDLWRSNSGADSWTKLSEWSLMYYGGGDDYVHCDQHFQLYTEGSSEKILIANDGGIFFTEDATVDLPVFSERNRNYNTLQFYTCDIYPNPDSNHFVGGAQDNGTLKYKGEPIAVTDMIDRGDGAYCFFDDDEPEILITSTYFNLYSIFDNWTFVDHMGMNGTGVFISPADYDSKNNTVYANAVKFNNSNPNSLLKIDGIPDNPVSQLISLPVNITTYFSNVKVSPFGPEGTTTLFLGSQNGRLFKVENAHSTPIVTEVGSDDFPTAYLSSIALGGSEDTLLVTFSNYGIPSVWQSYDAGTNWTDISGNLPDMPIRWCLYHPQDGKKIMLATELGIWSTEDASSQEISWEPDAGMPNVRIDMLKVRSADNLVLAATHGRGLIYTTWDISTSTASPTVFNYPNIQFYPNPTKDFIQLKLEKNQNAHVKIYNQAGQLKFEGFINGNQKVDLTDLSRGLYIIEIANEEKKSVGKIILN